MTNRRTNILIISVGASPPVVTETIWKLLQRAPQPWVPGAIHLVTTSKAQDEFRRRGLLGADGKIAELFAAFGHPYVEPEINIPRHRSGPQNGQLISDIRDEQENILYGNLITQLVKTYAKQPDTQIHMSLAGGRKIMSWYAGTAMSLFARPQDELSHVLVKSGNNNNPELLEQSEDFWWPGQAVNPVTHKFRKDADGAKLKVSIDGADIDMPLIPFVRLTPVLGDQASDVFLGDEIEYERIVDAVQDSLSARRITLHVPSSTLSIGRETASMENLPFAIYCLAAEALRDKWPGAGPQGIGESHSGWLTYDQILNENNLKKLLHYYSETFHGASDKLSDFEDLVACYIDGECPAHLPKKLKVSNADDALRAIKRRLEAAKGKIEGELDSKIRNVDLRQRVQLNKQKEGKPLKSYFGLLCDPADIRFDFSLTNDAE